MDKSRKEYIDSLWFHTKLYKWLTLMSSGNMEEAHNFLEDLFQKGYFEPAEQIEEEGCDAILKEIGDFSEFEDYLKLLDKENYDLVDVIITRGAFDGIYEALIK